MSVNEVESAHASHAIMQATLPDLLRGQARLRPDATAVTAGTEHLTYSELLLGAREVSGYLQHLNVTTDDCVGLYVEPSLDLMVGVWGILSAGAAYLPLSPEYPHERIRYMIRDSKTRVIVTQEHLAAQLKGFVPEGTTIVTLAEAEGFTPTAAAGPTSQHLAYVIYTSGSTGTPKGVMIEHRSIVSQMRWMRDCGHLGETVTVLQKTPMSFDAAQWEILAPAVGARTVMGNPGIYRDPEALIDVINEHAITTLQCVPTLLQALLDTEGFSRCTTLGRVFSGGEALSRNLAAVFLDELPWSSLVNLYGPTECTINSTAFQVDPDALTGAPASIPIGFPADNTQCFILDDTLTPVDLGETGELYIGGVQLARGYLGRPEQTFERFIPNPFIPTQRLYRTGDLASFNHDGTISFIGRADNQVKLRGYRIELEEIALAIEEHAWVRRAAVLVTDDPHSGFKNLVACIELDAKEAALMDQGNHGTHHQSKESKLQVKAQLSNPGLRSEADLASRPATVLPGQQESASTRATVFARKTYRFYEGGPVTRQDLLALLAPPVPTGFSRCLQELTLGDLGNILRWFGQFHSDERLLPKYAYASPGALYATQMYVETSGMAGLERGLYYYHPVDHNLVRIGDADQGTVSRLTVHFAGKKQAIEPVYKNNIQEVLEFETGHMIGVFEDVLPAYGLDIHPATYNPDTKQRLDVAVEDYYLGTFDIRPHDGKKPEDRTDLYIQIHPGRIDGMSQGHYRYNNGALEYLSDEVIQAKHVIAINQQVYHQASFGITAVSRETRPWMEYIALGTKLHHLQRNDLGIGLMSSGYSSKSGHPLPAARRMDDILTAHNIPTAASYFFIGGKVSDEQIRSEGMREDQIHMKGPAELIRDELSRTLPDYMIPNRALVLNELPLTANGKVDHQALAASDAITAARSPINYVAPHTPAERWIAGQWATLLHRENVSTQDDFFASGGNSLTAVMLVNKINREFGTKLPLQVVFEAPTLADLAERVDSHTGAAPSSRLILLNNQDTGRPVFAWPGLGGYPMNLRTLAHTAAGNRPFYGIQAYGINAGELPFPTIREMAAADVSEIRRVQPEGPYSLWGYSFGARVAFETAWQLEQFGEQVDRLILICPGNPTVRTADGTRHGRDASYTNPAYLTILFSVFTGTITGHDLDRCLKETRDEDTFVSFIHHLIPGLDKSWITRITKIVQETFEFDYTFRELAERHLTAPVTILKAQGDDYSFIEGHSGYSATPPTVTDLTGDHYSVLKSAGVGELADAIHQALRHT